VHGYRKWPALTVIAVFIIAALVVGTVAVRPHTEIAAVSKTNLPELQGTEQTKSNDVSTSETKNYTEHLSTDNFTQQTIAKINEHISNDESESVLIASSYNHTAENIIATAPPKITDYEVAIAQNEKAVIK
jgi:hypothetical protein